MLIINHSNRVDFLAQKYSDDPASKHILIEIDDMILIRVLNCKVNEDFFLGVGRLEQCLINDEERFAVE